MIPPKRILIDTVVWIDHFRSQIDHLIDLARRDQLCMHPFVIGELACGHLANRKAFLADMKRMQQIIVAEEEETLLLIESKKLMGLGLGYVDMHLLASARLNGVKIWTRDIRMRQAAIDLQLVYTFPVGSGPIQ